MESLYLQPVLVPIRVPTHVPIGPIGVWRRFSSSGGILQGSQVPSGWLIWLLPNWSRWCGSKDLVQPCGRLWPITSEAITFRRVTPRISRSLARRVLQRLQRVFWDAGNTAGHKIFWKHSLVGNHDTGPRQDHHLIKLHLCYWCYCLLSPVQRRREVRPSPPPSLVTSHWGRAHPPGQLCSPGSRMQQAAQEVKWASAQLCV